MLSSFVPEDFNFCTFHFHSIPNKMSTFRSLILLHGPDMVLATSETWLHDCVVDKEIGIRGGGICIYIESSSIFCPISLDSLVSFQKVAFLIILFVLTMGFLVTIVSHFNFAPFTTTTF